MTFREKLRKEHPEYIDPECVGGCEGCPDDYGYEDKSDRCPVVDMTNFREKCQACWDREIPGTEPTEEAPRTTIKVKYLADVEPLKKISVGDWIDLRAAEEVVMNPGEYKMIPLGVAMQLPKGYEAIVAPRSSTFKNYGILLVNSIGIIDESYCGDNDQWWFPALATRYTVIPKNERICQFRILEHQPQLELVEVEILGNADRGGIGSTGRL